MVTIEQVRLLEQKVTKAIDYVTRVSEENTLLKTRMESYQKRVDELEILIQRFKEEQSRIEESIVASLDKLNRFESSVGPAAYEGESVFTTMDTDSRTSSAAEYTAASAPPAAEPVLPPIDDELEEELDDAIAALSESSELHSAELHSAELHSAELHSAESHSALPSADGAATVAESSGASEGSGSSGSGSGASDGDMVGADLDIF